MTMPVSDARDPDRPGRAGAGRLPWRSRTRRRHPSARARPDRPADQGGRQAGPGAMRELRKKTEGASEPEADRREYVVDVELLNTQGRPEPPSRERSPPKSREEPSDQGAATPRADRDVVSLFR